MRRMLRIDGRWALVAITSVALVVGSVTPAGASPVLATDDPGPRDILSAPASTIAAQDRPSIPDGDFSLDPASPTEARGARSSVTSRIRLT